MDSIDWNNISSEGFLNILDQYSITEIISYQIECKTIFDYVCYKSNDINVFKTYINYFIKNMANQYILSYNPLINMSISTKPNYDCWQYYIRYLINNYSDYLLNDHNYWEIMCYYCKYDNILQEYFDFLILFKNDDWLNNFIFNKLYTLCFTKCNTFMFEFVEYLTINKKYNFLTITDNKLLLTPILSCASHRNYYYIKYWLDIIQKYNLATILLDQSYLICCIQDNTILDQLEKENLMSEILNIIVKSEQKIYLIDKFLEIDETQEELPKYFLDKIIEIKNSSVKASE